MSPARAHLPTRACHHSMLPPLRRLCRTQDGFERTIATNYLGHFYLAHLLLPELQGWVLTWQGWGWGWATFA